MNPQLLKRRPDRVKSVITKLPDGRLVVKEPVKIYIPARFAEHNLASIGAEIQIVGMYAIVLEDKSYGVMSANAMMRIEPSSFIKVMIDGDEYYEFSFDKGATMVSSVMLVRVDTLTYRIYDEIISNGRVPWYMSYDDLGKLFDTAPKHAGANIGQNNEVTELIVSMISRDPKDRSKYYRQTIKSMDELQTRPPVFIPLRNVTYAATNTTNKLAGSHFKDGLVSALVTPADRKERIESILLE